ncbi:hypothetical protein [Oleiharenicola sp. Vm1]|uniref:hypothetical protein n=1 Tax=Oleiharenicola sp. Vm1 TaxID=3398393 RepID=UPI0039F5A4A4
MNEVLRNTLAALAGALTGMMLILAVQTVSQRVFYPLPPDLNPKDAAAMAAYFKSLPTGAFLLVLLSYLVGVTAGAHVAGRFSSDGGPRQGVMVTGLFIVASLMNLLALPHPAWFWIANFAVVIFAGWLGLKLLPQRAAPAA